MLSTPPTLLDRLREPADQAAWERFVTLYAPVLEHWARRQGLREADVADLVQEVLLKVFRALPTYERRPGTPFRAWLGTIARNQCADFRRRRGTRPLPGSDGLSGADDPRGGDLEEVEHRRIVVHRTLDAIRPEFEPKTIEIFTRLMVDGKPVREVAAELGLEPAAVYKAKNRVLTRLRRELDGLLD